MNSLKAGIYLRVLKRPVDAVFSLLAIIILGPFMMVLAFLIYLKMGKPVLFQQTRVGRKEKEFTLYKFRTMTEERDESGNLLPDNQRIMRFGKFLRSSSLDELPELINILTGDMSFIGPRPLLPQYLPLYNEQQKRRHEVRPGLSGLAQVSGRNSITWEEKFNLDLRYIEHITLFGDLKILILTIIRVFKREGIQSPHSATMEPFLGSVDPEDPIIKPMHQLLIIGAGGHGKVVADIAMRTGKWDKICFLDDLQKSESCMEIPIIGKTDEVLGMVRDYDIFIAVGRNEVREKLHMKLEAAGANIPAIIAPDSVIGEQVIIGEGTVIMPGVVVNCCTRIGKSCILNTGSTVDHDCIIDDFVHVSPGVHLAGAVNVGKGTWLGIGSIIINNRHIAEHCILGAGALVVRDIKIPGTYIGVPAKLISEFD